MPTFNPSDYASESDGGGGGKLAHATTAVLIAESMERNTGAKADYFNVCFRVVTGDHSGAYFYDNLSLSDKALWRLGKIAVAMGQSDPLDLDDDDEVGDYFLDREFFGETEVEHDSQWGDRVRLNVKKLRPLTKDEEKEVREIYKEKGSAHDEGWRGKKSSATDSSDWHSRAEKNEDDVPF